MAQLQDDFLARCRFDGDRLEGLGPDRSDRLRELVRPAAERLCVLDPIGIGIGEKLEVAVPHLFHQQRLVRIRLHQHRQFVDALLVADSNELTDLLQVRHECLHRLLGHEVLIRSKAGRSVSFRRQRYHATPICPTGRSGQAMWSLVRRLPIRPASTFSRTRNHP